MRISIYLSAKFGTTFLSGFQIFERFRTGISSRIFQDRTETPEKTRTETLDRTIYNQHRFLEIREKSRIKISIEHEIQSIIIIILCISKLSII